MNTNFPSYCLQNLAAIEWGNKVPHFNDAYKDKGELENFSAILRNVAKDIECKRQINATSQTLVNKLICYTKYRKKTDPDERYIKIVKDVFQFFFYISPPIPRWELVLNNDEIRLIEVKEMEKLCRKSKYFDKLMKTSSGNTINLNLEHSITSQELIDWSRMGNPHNDFLSDAALCCHIQFNIFSSFYDILYPAIKELSLCEIESKEKFAIARQLLTLFLVQPANALEELKIIEEQVNILLKEEKVNASSQSIINGCFTRLEWKENPKIDDAIKYMVLPNLKWQIHHKSDGSIDQVSLEMMTRLCQSSDYFTALFKIESDRKENNIWLEKDHSKNELQVLLEMSLGNLELSVSTKELMDWSDSIVEENSMRALPKLLLNGSIFSFYQCTSALLAMKAPLYTALIDIMHLAVEKQYQIALHLWDYISLENFQIHPEFRSIINLLTKYANEYLYDIKENEPELMPEVLGVLNQRKIPIEEISFESSSESSWEEISSLEDYLMESDTIMPPI